MDLTLYGITPHFLQESELKADRSISDPFLRNYSTIGKRVGYRPVPIPIAAWQQRLTAQNHGGGGSSHGPGPVAPLPSAAPEPTPIGPPPPLIPAPPAAPTPKAVRTKKIKKPPREKEPEHPVRWDNPPPERPYKPPDRVIKVEPPPDVPAKKPKTVRRHARSVSYYGPAEPPHKPNEDEEPRPVARRAPSPPPTLARMDTTTPPPKDKKGLGIKLTHYKNAKKLHRRRKGTQGLPTSMDAEAPEPSQPAPPTQPPTPMEAEPTQSGAPVEGGHGNVHQLTLGGKKRKSHPTKGKDAPKREENLSYTSQLNKLTRRLHKETNPKRKAALGEAIRILSDLRMTKYKDDIKKRGLEAPGPKPIPKGRTKKEQKIHKKAKRLRKIQNEITLLKQALRNAGLTPDQYYDLIEAKAGKKKLLKKLDRAGYFKKK